MTETTSTTSHPLSLQSLQLPEPPGFWPLAWGWWSLIAAILITLIAIYVIWRLAKNRVRAKKAAIALLALEKETISPSGAMEIVRQAVLSYYPRSRVAHLSGEKWIDFLDSQVADPIFRADRQEWLDALYKKQVDFDKTKLIEQCDNWLNQALPPKRGGRG